MMSFFLSPFIFVFELIGFLISVAFVYGLALIAAITFLVYAFTRHPKPVEYVYTTKTVVETVEVEVSKTPERICIRLEGCKTFSDAKTEKEYCPTCVWSR